MLVLKLNVSGYNSDAQGGGEMFPTFLKSPGAAARTTGADSPLVFC